MLGKALILFLAQTMSVDVSCQNAMGDAAIKRLIGHLSLPLSLFTSGEITHGRPANRVSHSDNISTKATVSR